MSFGDMERPCQGVAEAVSPVFGEAASVCVASGWIADFEATEKVGRFDDESR